MLVYSKLPGGQRTMIKNAPVVDDSKCHLGRADIKTDSQFFRHDNTLADSMRSLGV